MFVQIIRWFIIVLVSYRHHTLTDSVHSIFNQSMTGHWLWQA